VTTIRTPTRRVAEVMLREPRVLHHAATLDQALELFTSAHVHMVVLTETGRIGGRLVGTLVRSDLPTTPPGAAAAAPAVTWARLVGRTVHAELPAQRALQLLRAGGRRRAAVVDDDGRLLGLLCLKRHGRGFCSDEDVLAKHRDPQS
jgi:CBS domain-containing protein